jgi:MoaA/NifB/PqqE/SkfB family radical SAM enzyme
MYCKQGIIGAQFSHTQRGHGLCCASVQRYHDSPKQVWHNKLKQARNQLINNEKIKDCITCYATEEKEIESFRQIYNQQFSNFNQQELPQHLDLDLSNFCNLKCIMCDSSRSSTWAKEVGHYTDTKGVTSITDHDLEEICELSHNLKYLTLQGGEPSIMPQYETYFNYLKNHNLLQNINLNVVTNLTNLQQRFYSYFPLFKSVNISVSIDAFGSANNFIRYPSNFDLLTKNIKTLREYNNLNVTINTAIQILSMFNIKEFVSWFNDLFIYFDSKKKYIGQYIQHVHTPEQLCILNAPASLKEIFLKQIKGTKFEYLAQSLEFNNNYNYKKTIEFINNICVNRNLNFEEYFPNFKLHYETV